MSKYQNSIFSAHNSAAFSLNIASWVRFFASFRFYTYFMNQLNIPADLSLSAR